MWPISVVSSEHCTFSDQEEMKSTPVIHSFGRGEFRERAKRAKIPDVLLDQLCNRASWSMSTTWATKVGGAERSKVLDQTSASGLRPRRGGRARALKLRSEQLEHSFTRPGRHSKVYSVPTLPSSACPSMSVYSQAPTSDYDHEWPVLKPGGISEEDSSDILTDELLCVPTSCTRPENHNPCSYHSEKRPSGHRCDFTNIAIQSCAKEMSLSRVSNAPQQPRVTSSLHPGLNHPSLDD